MPIYAETVATTFTSKALLYAETVATQFGRLKIALGSVSPP
jgi:hypothetical protein